jgi:hypothetical protein
MGLARDALGRTLFVPWHPFSRNAYVLPTPADRAAVTKQTHLFVTGWFVVLVVAAVSRAFLGASSGTVHAVVLLALGHWAWWTSRFTRGLERVRYEGPRP